MTPAFVAYILFERKESKSMHGLRCVWLIRDGDSLVYNSVVTGVTSCGRHNTKAECINYAIKCYQNRLEAFCNDKPHRRISVNMDCHGHSVTSDITVLHHDARFTSCHCTIIVTQWPSASRSKTGLNITTY